jgi:glucose-1-phosphate thymidylyltransferase
MKGILLAGGSGTRLYPITVVTSKQLLPVYNKPMVFFPLTTLILAGIKEVMLITTECALGQYQHLLGMGEKFGIKIEYKIQKKPEGIAQALILAEEFLDGEPCCLILGDNIIYGHDMMSLLGEVSEKEKGATIFGYHVHDPGAYGVVEFDRNGRVLSIEEKPARPRSNYAVPGLYFYDGRASEFARRVKPSKRGELEITDLNRLYMEEGTLEAVPMRRGWVWLDAGTPDGLHEAASFVQTIEKRSGLSVGCPEEAAYRMGFISREKLFERGQKHENSLYGQYLIKLAMEDGAPDWSRDSASAEAMR